MNTKKIKLLLFALLIGCWGCQQETLAPSNLALLTNRTEKSWQLISAEGDDSYYNSPCTLDNIWIFKINKDYRNPQSDNKEFIGFFEERRGTLRCYPSEPSLIYDASWNLNVEEDIIYMVYGTKGRKGSFKYEIIELTENKLVLQYTVLSTYGNKMYKTLYTFSAKK